MTRLALLLLYALVWCTTVQAQVITQISTVWDDRIDEWTIYTDVDDLEGVIELRWPLRNDLTEWRYELGEISGVIKQTWKGNSNSWEIVPYDDDRIIVKTVWNNDFSEWKVSQGSKIYRFKSKYKSQSFKWQIDQKNGDEFYIYMYDEPDPRNWLIEDYIEEGSLNLTIALAFTAIYNSLPRS